jgi:rubrerythrin
MNLSGQNNLLNLFKINQKMFIFNKLFNFSLKIMFFNGRPQKMGIQERIADSDGGYGALPSKYLKNWVFGLINKAGVSPAIGRYQKNHHNFSLSNKLPASENEASPKEKLIGLLKMAYSGELGAIFAYQGHRKSVSDPIEKQEILKIELEELEHRNRVGEMLVTLGYAPDPKLELQNHCIGKTIGLLCRIGGWFIPMYGAGKLESQNTGEYEEAAEYAVQSGHLELLDDLLTMAEVEWDHEKYFRDKCRTHFLYNWFPKWKTSPARESIRLAFAHLRYPKGQLFPQVPQSNRHAIFVRLAYAN